MALCPECESPLDFEDDEVEEGEVILCDECGSEFEVVTTDPLELARVEEGYVEEDDEAFVAEEEDE